MIKLLVPQHFQSDLERHLPQFELVPYDAAGTPLADSSGIEGFFRWWLSGERGDEILESHPSLRWIHTGSTGVDHILTPAFLRLRPLLTNSAGVHAPSIAEWVVMAMLAMRKGFPALLAQQRDRIWESVQRPEIAGSTVLFFGAGHIAQAIAKRLRPFGVTSIAARKSRSANATEPFDSLIPIGAIDDALAAADYVVLALPLTSETKDVLHAGRIARLKPNAVVVNVSRGEIVDEAALIRALQTRSIEGAILDVFREEPLPAISPFWGLENVYVLPHTTWRSPEVRGRQIELFAENAKRLVAGETLHNVVDVDAGY